MKNINPTPEWKKFIETPVTPIDILALSGKSFDEFRSCSESDLAKRLPEESFRSYIYRISA